MGRIVFTIFLTTFFIVCGFYYYYQKSSRNKKLFRESISQDILFLTFVAPLVAASLFTFLLSLIFKEGDKEKFFRSDTINLLAMFYCYGMYSVAQGIHALAKAFKAQAVKIKDQALLDLIRFFHGPFSHYVSNLSISLIAVLFFIFNINHPARTSLTFSETIIVVFCGLILGFCLAVAYIVGNTNRFLRWLAFIIFLVFWYIVRTTKISLLTTPMSLAIFFMFFTTFILLFLDLLVPKRNWFLSFIDKRFETVETSWEITLRQISKKEK